MESRRIKLLVSAKGTYFLKGIKKPQIADSFINKVEIALPTQKIKSAVVMSTAHKRLALVPKVNCILRNLYY